VNLAAVTDYLVYWRRLALPGREIIEGSVAPAHTGPSPELQAALDAWGGRYYWEAMGGRRWLVLVRELAPRRERWWRHAVLLVLTLLTASLGGAALAGFGSGFWIPVTVEMVRVGLPFSIPLLAILLAHESGHYMVARRYLVDASPPYFIPFPAQLNILGTMGAFIRLRSPVYDRRTLFDIGVAGPLAGIAVAIPTLLIGLALSEPVANAPVRELAHQYVRIGSSYLFLGDSLLMAALRALVAPEGVLLLHPVAVAGWAGVLVTMLNLLPLAQLDGGHITFATFGRAQRWIALAFWLSLLVMGAMFWMGWWLWAALGLILGRGRLTHPRVMEPERPLDQSRQWLAYLAILLFVLTFMPRPVAL
jgi:membrane-associated protease RseP (regulator of RpoE activity)